ncbi:MAG TPA: cobyrinate a,c-diamide synthase [Armatimonadota bacterium]
MSVPRLLVGGIRSGEGKTTVALGLMAALRQRGLTVQGFKVGPDYLDTGYQLLATGRPGRNLDLWMMGEEAVRRSVARHGDAAEIAVIEGVMGLFDGHRDGVTPTSSADVAKRLGAPVVLVIDAAHLAASAGAIALGFRLFDPEVNIAGVIFNRWNPSRSKVAVEMAMERAQVPVLGYLPSTQEIALPSRHLGLVIAEEMREEVEEILRRLAGLIAEYVDLERIIAIAQQAPALAEPVNEPDALPPVGNGLRIAVARDEAFAFYYPENCELLQDAGAEIVYFSPLTDQALPEADGLYLGGGYPELYAEALSGNTAMRESISQAIAAGLPTYAECGGLLYLCETLTDLEGKQWPMVGAVPRQVCMHSRLQRMGYREGILRSDSLLGKAGDRVRGHEFHYSSCEPEEAENAAYQLDGRAEGICAGNLFASYLHLHFAGCPQVAAHWLTCCRRQANRPVGGIR